jgi:4-hydroxybenzoate polyprenyltransferase
MVYDTIYAHQDKVDDVKVGIQSTALTFGDATKRYLVGFAGINIASMALVGSSMNCNLPFYIGLAAGALQLSWQIKTVDLDDPLDCARKFKSNWWYGLSIFSGIVADKLLTL